MPVWSVARYHFYTSNDDKSPVVTLVIEDLRGFYGLNDFNINKLIETYSEYHPLVTDFCMILFETGVAFSTLTLFSTRRGGGYLPLMEDLAIFGRKAVSERDN